MASPYKEAVLATAGLVAFWPLEESAGTEATDLKNSLTGTYSGSITLGQTSLLPNGEGKAAHFTGGKMEKGDTEKLRLGKEAMSLECWFKIDSLAAGNQAIWDNTNRGYSQFLNSSGAAKVLSAFGTTTSGTADEIGELVVGTVYHYVVVSTGTKVLYYKNGALVKEVAFTPGGTNSTAGVAFAANPSGGGGAFQGYGQYFAVYNTAISKATVEAHYAAGSQATSPMSFQFPLSRRNPIRTS